VRATLMKLIYYRVKLENGEQGQLRLIKIDHEQRLVELETKVCERFDRLPEFDSNSIRWFRSLRDSVEIPITVSLSSLAEEVNEPGSISSPLTLDYLKRSVKRQRGDWETRGTILPINYYPDHSFVEIPKELASIIDEDKGNSILLYQRDCFNRQLNFMKQSVIEQNYVGWLLGPPGTGKSLTAFAFARELASSGWSCIWVDCNSTRDITLLKMTDDRAYAADVTRLQLPDWLQSNLSGKTLILLDGYSTRSDPDSGLLDEIYKWHRGPAFTVNTDHAASPRRLCVVSSMAGRGHLKPHLDAKRRIVELLIESWSMGEFEAACGYDEFWESVKPNLIIPESPDQSRESLIAEKFYFTGGSARHMFAFSRARATDAIKTALRTVSDIRPYLSKGFGDRSNNVVNQLFGLYLNPQGEPFSFLVSEYAARLVSTNNGPSCVIQIIEELRLDLNIGE
jgi:hypothetical protein